MYQRQGRSSGPCQTCWRFTHQRFHVRRNPTRYADTITRIAETGSIVLYLQHREIVNPANESLELLLVPRKLLLRRWLHTVGQVNAGAHTSCDLSTPSFLALNGFGGSKARALAGCVSVGHSENQGPTQINTSSMGAESAVWTAISPWSQEVTSGSFSCLMDGRFRAWGFAPGAGTSLAMFERLSFILESGWCKTCPPVVLPPVDLPLAACGFAPGDCKGWLASHSRGISGPASHWFRLSAACVCQRGFWSESGEL